MRAALAIGALLSLAGTARAQPAAAAPEPPAPETPAAPAPLTPSSLELADRLRAMASYGECAVEALRHAYVHPGERRRGFERAALCLTLASRFEDARRLMLALAAADPLDGPGRLRICLTEVFMRELGAPACPDLVRVSSNRDPDRVPRPPRWAAAAKPPSPDALLALGRHTLLMRALHDGQWDAARALLAGAPAPAGTAATADPTLASWQARDRDFLAREQALPRKSPWLAAALSMAVPGLGRVYVGRWQDGLVSFLLVGVAAGLSARSFHEDGQGSVSGWLLGATAAMFYVGNIYGSAVGALVQHRDRERELLLDVDKDYRERLDP